MNKIFAFKGRNVSKPDLVKAAYKMKSASSSTTFKNIDDVFLGVHRTPVVDLTHRADQPFVDYDNDRFLICDGRVYNNRFLKQKLVKYDYLTTNDCEVILPLLSAVDVTTACQALDGDFSFVSYNSSKKEFVIARDLFGARSLFYGENPDGDIAVASDEEVLHDLFQLVKPFPVGTVYKNGTCNIFRSLKSNVNKTHPVNKSYKTLIENAIIEAIVKRLQSDREIVFEFSNNLYSRIICLIASKALGCRIKTISFEIENTNKSKAYCFFEKVGIDNISITKESQKETWFSKNTKVKTMISSIFPLDENGKLKTTSLSAERGKTPHFFEIRAPYYDLHLVDLFLEYKDNVNINEILTEMGEKLYQPINKV